MGESEWSFPLEVTQLLQLLTTSIGESEDFETALKTVLKQVCELTDWNMGEVWMPNEADQRLHPSPVWYAKVPERWKHFRAATIQFRLRAGQGLPGRVWQSRVPEWVPDVSTWPPSQFVRLEVALASGVKAGLAVPIVAGSLPTGKEATSPLGAQQGRVVAVLAFFRFESWLEDAQRVSLVTAIAAQLGPIIQLKQAQTHLAASRNHLRRLVDSLPGIVFVGNNDADWSMQYLSAGCFALTGYRSDELVGEQRLVSFNDITNPEDLPHMLQVISEAIAQRQPYVVEYRIRTKRGEEKWLWEKGYGVFDTMGQVQGIEGFITDTTDRKQMENALRNSEQLFRSLFDRAAMGICLNDREGRLQDCNAAFEDFLGYSLDEMHARHFHNWTYPDDLAEDVALLYEILEGDRDSFQLEKRYIRKDGQIVWGKLTISAIRNADGDAIATFGFVENISQRKQAEAALKAQEAQSRQLLHAIPEILFVMDADGVYRYVQAEDEADLLYPPEEILGKSIEQLLPTTLTQQLRQNMQKVRETGHYQAIDYQLSFDGEVRYFEGRVAPYGQSSFVVTVRNISERKRAERAVQEQEAFLRLVLDAIPQHIFWKDTDLVYRGGNHAFAEAVGLEDPEELVGKTDADLWTLEQATSLVERDRLLLETQQPVHNVVQQKRLGDGRIIWQDIDQVLIHDADNHIVGILGTYENITERYRANELLAGQKRLLEMIARDRPLQDTLEELLRIIQAQKPESSPSILMLNADGTHVQQGVSLDLPRAYMESVNNLAIGPNVGTCGTAMYFGCITITPDIRLDPLWEGFRDLVLPYGLISCWSMPVVSSQGRILGSFATYHREPQTPTLHEVQLVEMACQIAAIAIEQQLANEALQRAEARYRGIFENAVEGIFQSTVDGQYTIVNPMLANIYGYDSPEELMASLTNISQQVYVSAQRRLEFTQEMREKGLVQGFESQVYRKDGSIIWVSEGARTLLNEAGEIVGYEGTVEDITPRKQAEDELLKRDEFLLGVASATHQLLTEAEFDQAIQNVLQILGQAARADRTYIYQNHPHSLTGAVAMSIRYEWTNDDVAPTFPCAHWHDLPYHQSGLGKWYEHFLAGRSFSGVTRLMSPPEQAMLDRDQIRSIIMVPIHIDQELWGYIGFDDCHTEREWTASEESMLVAIAASIAAAIQRQHTDAQMRYQAFHDALTGLPNRTLYDHRLSVTLAQARRSGETVGVMFLDLDRFKTINDTLGHAAGDQLLKLTTQRLTHCLREEDTIARWGGDEFTLLLPFLKTPEEAAMVAHRIAHALKPVFRLNGHDLHITCSLGIAIYPQDGTDPETLLKNADVALYRAKEQGRNNYQFYTATLNSRASERLTLDHSLHKALEQEELVLYYQPQFDLRTGEIQQIEALIRWQHPRLGMLAPQLFIPLAEENGLIMPIGDWVIETACRQLQQWHQMGFAHLKLAVNLSAHQFQQLNLVESIAQLLQTLNFNPQMLELEITETTFMKDMPFTQTLLHLLREMGICIALDDFGTGYSSMNYLRELPINTLKIDRSFVRDISTCSRAAAIIATIITLGHGLDLNVVAEGVETMEQQEQLRSLNCYSMQGFLFSQPLDTATTTQFLLNHQKATHPLYNPPL